MYPGMDMGCAAEVHDGSGPLNAPDIPNAIFANVILLVESHVKLIKARLVDQFEGFVDITLPQITQRFSERPARK